MPFLKRFAEEPIYKYILQLSQTILMVDPRLEELGIDLAYASSESHKWGPDIGQSLRAITLGVRTKTRFRTYECVIESPWSSWLR